MAIDSQDRILYRKGGIYGSSWEEIDGRARKVSVADDGTAWVVDKGNYIYKRPMNKGDWKGGWAVQRGINAIDVSANGNETVALDTDGAPRKYNNER